MCLDCAVTGSGTSAIVDPSGSGANILSRWNGTAWQPASAAGTAIAFGETAVDAASGVQFVDGAAAGIDFFLDQGANPETFEPRVDPSEVDVASAALWATGSTLAEPVLDVNVVDGTHIDLGTEEEGSLAGYDDSGVLIQRGPCTENQSLVWDANGVPQCSAVSSAITAFGETTTGEVGTTNDATTETLTFHDDLTIFLDGDAAGAGAGVLNIGASDGAGSGTINAYIDEEGNASFATVAIDSTATPTWSFNDSDFTDPAGNEGEVVVNCPTAGDCDMAFKTKTGGTSTEVFRIDTTDAGAQTVIFTGVPVTPAGGIEVENTDSTLTRVSAGLLAVEGVALTRTIAAGQEALATSVIASEACSTAHTGLTATGVA